MSKKLAFLSSQIGFLLMTAAVYAQNQPLVEPPNSAVTGAGKAEKIPSIIVQWLFLIAAVLAIIYLVIGGIRWITSRGDKAAVEGARKQIIAAIVGLVVVALAFLIINVVFKALGIHQNPLEGNFDIPHL